MSRRRRYANARVNIRNTAPAAAPPRPTAPARPGRGAPAGEKKDRGFRVENLVSTETGPTTVKVWIYAEIGDWGVTAQEFVPALQAITADVIEVHLNSPGGDVFDGVAIYNALRQHAARIVVHIDGLAASAASFIAQAGDHVYIARNAQMMIHEASGICFGNAGDMTAMAEVLERCSNSIADIYSQKAGSTVASWRKAMKVETWYDSKEAVAAGLADEVEVIEADRAANEFDLSVFAYSGRANAPLPVPVSAKSEEDEDDKPDEEETVEPGNTTEDGEEPGESEEDATEDGEDEPEDERPAAEFHFDPAVFTGAMTASLEPAGFDATDFRDLMESVGLDAPRPPDPNQSAPAATAPLPRVPEPDPEPDPVGAFADLFRGAVALVANDAPAPPRPQAPVPAETDTGFSIDLFRRALEEASL
ncbi:MAG TPA: head maturation protease, ClpP-related [Amycolatopsis sp.]|nr:head maturation protease, ClpP-related [Amycolatopsis sp.]